MTLIVGSVETTGEPLIVASIVLLPSALAVNVAVYVPLLLSVAELIVPCALPSPSLKTTFSPPVVIVLPGLHPACSVIVVFPSSCTFPGDTVTIEFSRLAVPGITSKALLAMETCPVLIACRVKP